MFSWETERWLRDPKDVPFLSPLLSPKHDATPAHLGLRHRRRAAARVGRKRALRQLGVLRRRSRSGRRRPHRATTAAGAGVRAAGLLLLLLLLVVFARRGVEARHELALLVGGDRGLRREARAAL